MSGIKVCDIGDDIMAVAKKLRFRKDKNNAAFIIKINMAEMKCEIEEQLEDCSIEEVILFFRIITILFFAILT